MVRNFSPKALALYPFRTVCPVSGSKVILPDLPDISAVQPEIVESGPIDLAVQWWDGQISARARLSRQLRLKTAAAVTKCTDRVGAFEFNLIHEAIIG